MEDKNEVQENKDLKGRFKYSIYFGFTSYLITLMGLILYKIDIISFSYKQEIITAGIVLSLFLIQEALSFDENHKIISTISLVVVSFLIFKYLSKSINILNTNYKEEIMKVSAISTNYAYFSFIYLFSSSSILKKGLIKAVEYVKTAQREYEEKLKNE